MFFRIHVFQDSCISGSRLIVDLRYVNKHIYKERIKFEDLKLVERFLNHMSTCSSLTSNKAIIILIFINHIKNGRLKGGGCETCYFVFTVLPFGLTSALLIFTKVMRCLVKHWRINAIRINAIIENQPSWDSRVNLTHYEKATKKLIFWKNNINEFNKKP